MRLAIIPARGGSKGLPGKNLATINGETLIARCVRTCREAGLSVCVSTDHPGIAIQAIDAGANVTKRPPGLCGDNATSQDAMRHVLWDHPEVTEVVFAQCTSPMLTTSDIHGTLDALHGNDLAICCNQFDGILLDCGGSLINQPLDFNPNRQKRATQYVVSGHCWALRPEYLDRPWMSGRIGIHVASYPYRIDIDHQSDLDLARQVIGNSDAGRAIYCGDAGAFV